MKPLDCRQLLGLWAWCRTAVFVQGCESQYLNLVVANFTLIEGCYKKSQWTSLERWVWTSKEGEIVGTTFGILGSFVSNLDYASSRCIESRVVLRHLFQLVLHCAICPPLLPSNVPYIHQRRTRSSYRFRPSLDDHNQIFDSQPRGTYLSVSTPSPRPPRLFF